MHPATSMERHLARVMDDLPAADVPQLMSMSRAAVDAALVVQTVGAHGSYC